MSAPTHQPARPDLPPPTPPPAPPTGPGRRRPAAIGWGLALVLAGTLWLLAVLGVAIPWRVVLPVALVVVGVTLLVTRGTRGGDGLVGLGIVLTIVALLLTGTPRAPAVSAGERIHRVTDVAVLEDGYTLGAGQLTIDLRELDLPAGTTRLEASVGLGELRIHVPDGVAVTGTGTVFAGEAAAFGRTQSGIAPRLTIDEPAGRPGGGTLELDLAVGLGQIEVTR